MNRVQVHWSELDQSLLPGISIENQLEAELCKQGEEEEYVPQIEFQEFPA